MRGFKPKKGWEGALEFQTLVSFWELLQEMAEMGGKKGDFTPNPSWALPGGAGSSWEFIFWGGKAEFWGWYRFVLLGQVLEGEGRLWVHEIVGDVPERGHQDELAARTGGKEGKKKIFGVKSGVFGEKNPPWGCSCAHLLVPSMMVLRQSLNTSEKEPRSWQLWIGAKPRDWHNFGVFWGVWGCPKPAGIEGILGGLPPHLHLLVFGVQERPKLWKKWEKMAKNHKSSPKKLIFNNSH